MMFSNQVSKVCNVLCEVEDAHVAILICLFFIYLFVLFILPSNFNLIYFLWNLSFAIFVYCCAVLYCMVFSFIDTSRLQRQHTETHTEDWLINNRSYENNPDLPVKYESELKLCGNSTCVCYYSVDRAKWNQAWLQVSVCTWLQLARWAFSPDTLE